MFGYECTRYFKFCEWKSQESRNWFGLVSEIVLRETFKIIQDSESKVTFFNLG